MQLVSKWLALKNVVVAYPWHVDSGGLLDHWNRSLWHPLENADIEPIYLATTPEGEPIYEIDGRTQATGQEILQAGSIFTGKLGRQREFVWLRDHVVVAYDDKQPALHFKEMDDLFSEKVNAPGLGDGEFTLADVLRAHDFYSLESVINNEAGSTPVFNPSGKSMPIHAWEVLATYLDKSARDALIEQAKQMSEGV